MFIPLNENEKQTILNFVSTIGNNQYRKTLKWYLINREDYTISSQQAKLIASKVIYHCLCEFSVYPLTNKFTPPLEAETRALFDFWDNFHVVQEHIRLFFSNSRN